MNRDAFTQQYLAGGGRLSGDALERAAGIAWSYLVQQTMGRIERCDDTEIPELLPCFLELTDTIGTFQAQHCLTRETVGDWTRTYRSGTESLEERCREIVCRWLGETELLYRGWPE